MQLTYTILHNRHLGITETETDMGTEIETIPFDYYFSVKTKFKTVANIHTKGFTYLFRVKQSVFNITVDFSL